MLRLWPPIVPIDHRDDASLDSDFSAALNGSAGLSRQSIHVEPQVGGWKITVDSAVETGKVELFVPQNRDQPAQIVSDTRNESTYLPFSQLFSLGHFTEAAIAAEHELKMARQSALRLAEAPNKDSADKATASETRSLVEKLQQVAKASQRKGDYDRAETIANEAIAICELAPDDYSEILMQMQHLRLSILCFNRPADDASTQSPRREMDRLRQRSEQLLGLEHPETARIMTSQARLQISDFSYAQAEDLLKEAIRIQTEALGENSLVVSESLLELARLNAFEEKNDLAETGFRRVLSIREEKCGPDHPDVADVLFHFTDFLIYNQGDGAQAGSLLRRAMKIWSETIGLDHSSVVKESGFIRKVLAVDAESVAAPNGN